jgi:RNA polymerase sigma factor (sigma-70 family)
MTWVEKAYEDPAVINKELENKLPLLEAEARRLLGDFKPRNLEIDDLVNDVVVKALNVFRPNGTNARFVGDCEGEWVNWLKRIMRNALIDRLRSKSENTLNFIINNLESVIPGFKEPPDPERTPRSRLHVKLLAEAIRRELDKLRPSYRIVFEMYVADGLPISLIARVLGLEEGATWQRYRRARDAIRTSLGHLEI